MKPIDEVDGPVEAGRFAELRAQNTPFVMRGLVADWPAVEASRTGPEAIVPYLRSAATYATVRAIIAPPEFGGRFFYNADLTGFNFQSGRGPLAMFLDDLATAASIDGAPAMAVQSEILAEVLPQVAAENPLALLPGVPARIWIGNRVRVAPHYDVKENVACCVAGRRRFTLFPPDQVANLYPGPFELTPAGTPVSMVNLAQPDLAMYPRFEVALTTAQEATLEPGDAIYIPYCWWHGVESLDAVNVLVNYWWTEGEPHGVGGAYDALLHCLLAYRHLPPAQREVWRTMLDHYVFEKSGDPAAHLPEHAKGVLGPASPSLFARMRSIILGAIEGR